MFKINLTFRATVTPETFVALHCQPDKETQQAFKATEDGLADVKDFARRLSLPCQETVLADVFWPPVTVWQLGANLAFLQVGDDGLPFAVTPASVRAASLAAVYWQTLDGGTVYLEDELHHETADVLAVNNLDRPTVTVLLKTGEVVTLEPTIKIGG